MKITTELWDQGRFMVNSEFAELLRRNNLTTAQALWRVRGEPVKNVLKERGTEQVHLDSEGENQPVECYIKRYRPVPLKEHIKAVLSLKKRAFDAWDEWNAIMAFHQNDLPTMTPVAVARIGRKSCNLTLRIPDYRRASEIFQDFGPGEQGMKRLLIAKLADIAGRMHAKGIAHQDFYLVHIFVTGQRFENAYLIDLQRAIIRKNLPIRWIIKDLGQLLFSARPYVTDADVLYFWKRYTHITGTAWYRDKKLIRAVFRKAGRIGRHHEKRANRHATK